MESIFYRKKCGLLKRKLSLDDNVRKYIPELLDYAFALEIKPHKGLKTVIHGGALGGYKSALFRFPEHNFSVYFNKNTWG